MQIKNIGIFDSTAIITSPPAATATGAWIDISNLVSLSVHITGVESKTWIEVSNDPYVNIDGSGASGTDLVAAPVSGPTLSQGPAAFGGLSNQGTYFVKVTYITPWGETTASPESSLAVSDNYVLFIAPPPADVTGLAAGWNAYVGKSSGKEVLQTGPAYIPAHTVDATPGIHFAINGVLPLGIGLSLVNGYASTGVAVPASNTAGGIGVGTNVLGTSGDLSSASQTDAAISIFKDTNNNQVVWSPAGMTWKWLRVRKTPLGSLDTVAWLTGQNG
jgi:hypothetical protein